LFTGDLGLSIPIFTLPGRSGLDLPISLSYSSGIKVDQEASWVGLGWSLGPGMISRSVNFEADDDPTYGYLRDGRYDIILKRGDVGNTQDTYFVSFGAGGGRIILEDNANGKAHLESWKPWQIVYSLEPSGGIDSWTIVTEDGTKYFFDLALETQNTQVNKYEIQKNANNINQCDCISQWTAEPNTMQPYDCGGRGGYSIRECDYTCGTGCRTTYHCNPGGGGSSPIFSPILKVEPEFEFPEFSPPRTSLKEKLENALDKFSLTNDNSETENAINEENEETLFRSPQNPLPGDATVPLCKNLKWPTRCTETSNGIVTNRIYEPAPADNTRVYQVDPVEIIGYTDNYLQRKAIDKMNLFSQELNTERTNAYNRWPELWSTETALKDIMNAGGKRLKKHQKHLNLPLL